MRKLRGADKYHEAVFVNLCPKCQGVLRTPEAKVGLWCGHSQF